MNKTEFLGALRGKLAGRMGEEELQNALSYYEEYLEDAGPEREQEVLEELGSPEAVAAQVLGEQERSYIPPKAKRTSHTGIIVLCVVLGVVLMGTIALVVLSFAGRQTYVGEPQVSASAPVLVEPSVSAKPSQSIYGPNEVPAIGAFTNLDIDLGVGTVQVRKGNAYDLSLKSSGVDKNGVPYELHYTIEDDLLKIWSTPQSLSIDGGPTPEGEVVITVPEGAVLDRVNLKIGMGDLEWSGCAVSEKLSADIGMGDIVVSGPLTGKVDLEAGMGSVTANMELGREQYSYELEAGMGTLHLDGGKLSGTSVEGGKGPNEVDLSSGMGDIELKFNEK